MKINKLAIALGCLVLTVSAGAYASVYECTNKDPGPDPACDAKINMHQVYKDPSAPIFLPCNDMVMTGNQVKYDQKQFETLPDSTKWDALGNQSFKTKSKFGDYGSGWFVSVKPEGKKLKLNTSVIINYKGKKILQCEGGVFEYTRNNS